VAQILAIQEEPMALRVLLLLALALCSSFAAAQAYPAKPINFILPFPPGSPDMAARVYAEQVSGTIGQRIVVSNVGGSGGVQAAVQVKQSAPDGYTLFAGTSGAMALIKAVRSDLPYDPDRDFAPVTQLFSMPTFVTVHSATPFKSMPDLLAQAKKSPGKFTFGSQGVASPGHFQGAMLTGATGTDIVHIPYKGGIAMILDMVAQRVDIGFNTWSATKEYVRAGKLRYLAVTTEVRRPEEPDVPTLDELGIRGVAHDTWIGLFVPAKTPDAVITRLNQDFVRASTAPELVKRLSAEGFLIRTGTPEQLRKHMASESEILRVAAKKYNIKAD
jgi:tripartite-type tricarboxylate transporter receptor subunit TctC